MNKWLQNLAPTKDLIRYPYPPSFDLHTSVGVRMVEYMRTGAGIEQFNDEPGKQAPWEYSHNGKSFWKILEEDPEYKRDFDLYMAARRQGDLVPEWFQLYPVGTELTPPTTAPSGGSSSSSNTGSLKTGKGDVLLVDVAGGRGHDVGKFRAQFPQLPGRCILQDLPETIAQVRQTTPPPGVELMEYDFFTPQPIKGKSPILLLTSHFLSMKYPLVQIRQMPASFPSVYLQSVLHI